MRNVAGLSDDAASKFGHYVFGRLQAAPFGTTPKTEFDQILLAALIHSDVIDADSSVFELAQTLQVTPSRADSLIYNYRLREQSSALSPTELIRHVRLVDISATEDTVTLNIEGKYWRDALVHHLKVKGCYADFTLNREKLILASDKFIKFLIDEVPDDQLQRDILKALRRAKFEEVRTTIIGILKKSLAAPTGHAVTAAGVSLASLILN